ncbi:hypothetical protein GCM10009558_000030 [Virgisporangium aurantiacum]
MLAAEPCGGADLLDLWIRREPENVDVDAVLRAWMVGAGQSGGEEHGQLRALLRRTAGVPGEVGVVVERGLRVLADSLADRPPVGARVEGVQDRPLVQLQDAVVDAGGGGQGFRPAAGNRVLDGRVEAGAEVVAELRDVPRGVGGGHAAAPVARSGTLYRTAGGAVDPSPARVNVPCPRC